MISLLKLDSNTIKGEKKEVLEEQIEEEQGRAEEVETLDPYSMFIFAMNSCATQKKYTGRLIRLLDFIGLRQGTTSERCKVFVNKATNDNKWVVNNIVRFLQTQKQRVESREITGATLNNYVKTLKLFCEVTDIPIQWKKIARGYQALR
jgi:hypothetical protein